MKTIIGIFLLACICVWIFELFKQNYGVVLLVIGIIALGKYLTWSKKRKLAKKLPVFVPEFLDAADLAFQEKTISVPAVQRKFGMEYDEAFNIVSKMEELGIVSKEKKNGQRILLITKKEYDAAYNEAVRLTNIHRRNFSKELEKSRKREDAHNEELVRILTCNVEKARSEGDLEKEQFWMKYLEEEKQKAFNQSQLNTQEIATTPSSLNIDNMDGVTFEIYCAELLKKNGFSNVSLTKSSGDQGVDILAEKDGIRYAIQCKCYSSDLGNTPVQEVYAGKAFYNCHVGIVMTNRHFTSGAHQAAQATGVLLWDRDWILSHLKCD